VSWIDEAQQAWSEHVRRSQEEAERIAARTVDYVERLGGRLHLPTADARAAVEGDTVRLALRLDSRLWPSGVLGAELRAEVAEDDVPDVHVWLRLPGDDPRQRSWIDRGPVETLADLGRAFDPTVVVADPEPEQQTTSELLQTVLYAIVRDVVADELDGRLGRGKT
jgi:hypothetical protein